MEQMKVYISEEAITISKMPNNSYRNAKRLIVGRENVNEIRSYLIFENPLLKVDFDIEKIELVLFLKEIDLKSSTDKFMLNIGISIEQINEKITWNTSPKFFQESIMYKVSDNYKEKYIKFDITHIYKKHQKYISGKLCLSLLGLNANATVEFASSDSEKKGYLEIYKGLKTNINNKNEDIKIKQSNKADEISKSNNTIHKEIDVSKVYCEVYTTENKIVNRGKFSSIILEKLVAYNGAYLDKEKLGIIVLKPGVYNVQYTVNCISEGISTMGISIDDSIVESSIAQIGNNEGQITGQCIVRLTKGSEIIRLNIDGDKIILINIGVAAKMTLIEI